VFPGVTRSTLMMGGHGSSQVSIISTMVESSASVQSASAWNEDGLNGSAGRDDVKASRLQVVSDFTQRTELAKILISQNV
jgi:hypothetical protein